MRLSGIVELEALERERNLCKMIYIRFAVLSLVLPQKILCNLVVLYWVIFVFFFTVFKVCTKVLFLFQAVYYKYTKPLNDQIVSIRFCFWYLVDVVKSVQYTSLHHIFIKEYHIIEKSGKIKQQAESIFYHSFALNAYNFCFFFLFIKL